MSAFRNYFLSLTAVVFLTAFLRALIGGKHKTILSFVCSLCVILVAATPILRLEQKDITAAIQRILFYQTANEPAIPKNNQQILADIIKEKSEAYIWDKAKELGCSLSAVRVTTEAGEQPYPDGVQLTGCYTPTQKLSLSRWIEGELGITEERQKWIWNEST